MWTDELIDEEAYAALLWKIFHALVIGGAREVDAPYRWHSDEQLASIECLAGADPSRCGDVARRSSRPPPVGS